MSQTRCRATLSASINLQTLELVSTFTDYMTAWFSFLCPSVTPRDPGHAA